ncbi:MAG: MarR family winged helix-turn-helix transcriptional regulator [Planctomycetota bacterium]
MTVKPSTQVDPWEQLFTLMAAMQSVLQQAQPALAGLGMDAKSLFVLLLVDYHPSPAELADALVLPRPTVTTLIKKMETAGYLERRGVPGDLRRFHLAVTSAGIKARTQGVDVLDKIHGQRLAKLGRADQRKLTQLLQAIADPCSKLLGR